MRFLHTSDWHLGRLFHGAHLTDDQAHVLDQFVALARDLRPDLVVVSGDVYDRAVPPPEAVHLLDDVLSRLVLDLGLRVVVIAGNHDSPDRLAFGSRLLAERGLHVFGLLERPALVLEDRHGPVAVHAVPYAEPPVIRDRLGRTDLHTHDEAMRAWLEDIGGPGARSVGDSSPRSILVAHAFAAGCLQSDSERFLTVGGAGTVDVAAFEGFDYVALGHLHGPQSPVPGRVEYSGSLLKYSFSEEAQTKSVALVEMDEGGACRVERIALTPRRDVRRIDGLLQDLLKAPPSEDYVLAILRDKGPLLEPMRRLQEIYPNLLALERPEMVVDGAIDPHAADHRTVSDRDLFRVFFREVTGEELDPEQESAYGDIVDAMRRTERESWLDGEDAG